MVVKRVGDVSQTTNDAVNDEAERIATARFTACRRPARPVRALCVHLLRVGLLLTMVVLMRQRHFEWRSQQALLRTGSLPISRVRQFLPTAHALRGGEAEHRAQIVLDAAGETLGYVVQTSPDADHIVGYAGPTNVMLVFDRDQHVAGLSVLESHDTVEHVADVTRNRRFMHSYNGLDWQEAGLRRDVDAVSGATLTSLAIVEAIGVRLGQPGPSLRFPQPLTVDELNEMLPTATRLQPRGRQPMVFDVFDQHDQLIGSVVRTSPLCDGIVGYQGPTDSCIVLNAQQQVAGVMIRSSYDNQPYVRYVREDKYFGALFNGYELTQLAALDLEAAEVEGVSGATMTSMAVARTLTQVAGAAIVLAPDEPRWNVSAHDVGTIVILTLGLTFCFTHWRGRPRLQVMFRLVLVGYFGLMNGDMLSQALLVGWSQNGPSWRLAPGLVLLAAAALLVPMLTRRQVYCQHVCPFGAAQQLMAGRIHRRWPLPRRVRQGLTLVPAALLLVVVLTAMLHLPIDLASLEPFDAFIFWIAGTAALVIAAVGLAASTVVPLAYCRFGCPTGAVLEYVRFRGSSDRLTRRDLVAVGLLVLAWAL